MRQFTKLFAKNYRHRMAMGALNWTRSVLVLCKCFKWFSCIQWSTSTMLYGSNADEETSINFNSNWRHSYAMNPNTFKFAMNAIHTNGTGAYIEQRSIGTFRSSSMLKINVTASEGSANAAGWLNWLRNAHLKTVALGRHFRCEHSMISIEIWCKWWRRWYWCKTNSNNS